MAMDSPMILFFPQYQAGLVPSRIPMGTPVLRALWERAPGFAEVPLQPTDQAVPETEGNIRFRRILHRQRQDAIRIIDQARPDFIVVTGGDCGASFAPIAYMNERLCGRIGVVWIDAHADIHAPSTSPSGNYHGMVLRHLMGHPAFDAPPPLPLKPEQIAYLGLRDTEQEEDEFIRSNGIPYFSAAEVMKGDGPLDAVVAHFRRHGVTHLHLHVDCDVMDEAVFRFVHVPEPDGLTLERLLNVLRYLRNEMPMASGCLTEYAPDVPGAGMDVIRRLYTEGLGLTLPA